jgi:hypothetical protein
MREGRGREEKKLKGGAGGENKSLPLPLSLKDGES